MNKTFKVVFSKARGTLMVVNELTSSVQAKGTKTVVAAAVALAMGSVAAAGADEVMPPDEDTPAVEQSVWTDGKTTSVVINAGEVQKVDSFDTSSTGSNDTTSVKDVVVNLNFARASSILTKRLFL